MANPEKPRGQERSAEAENRPDAGIERKIGLEAQKATQNIRDISRSITSTERLLTSSASLKELRNDKVREALQTKRTSLAQRLKKLSAVALAGMIGLGALLQREEKGPAEDQGKDVTSEVTGTARAAESAPSEVRQEEPETAGMTEDERAALLGFVLVIAEQLRQDKYPHEVVETDEDEEPVPPPDPLDPFSEAYTREYEMQRKIDETEEKIEREQAEQERDDHATDQAATTVNDLLATSPRDLADMLRFRNREKLFAMYRREADERGVEFDLFDKKMAEAIGNLITDTRGKMRDGSEMTAAEREIAAVLADEDRKTPEQRAEERRRTDEQDEQG